MATTASSGYKRRALDMLPFLRRTQALLASGWAGKVLGVVGVGFGFMLLLAALAAALRPALDTGPAPHSVQEIERAVRARDVSFDPAHPERLPRIQRDVDTTLGTAAAWYPKGESPLLAELVAEGKLPPVAERTGPLPVVLDGGEPGQYGGTWLRAATSDFDVFIVEFRLGYASLLRWSPLGYPVVPHLATKVDASADRREFVVHLRPGVRWSDGAPFGADDIVFWWKYEDTNASVGDIAPSRWMVVAGGKTELEKLDDQRVLFRFEHPFGAFEEMLAAYSYFMTTVPKHYFEKYHPDLGDPAFIQAEMNALGQASPRALYQYLKRFSNPECPRLWPWVPRAPSTNPPFVYVRNPYYFAVDPQGNQLPYIDRLQFDVKTQQMLALSVSNGDMTMQDRYLRYENYTELMSRQAAGGFTVLQWYPASRSDWLIHPNHTRMVDPDRPETAHKARLLGDKRFAQALSLAIDRPAIIKAEYNDQVRPVQVEPGPQSPFHSPKLASAFIEHDPARASALLDELGLVQRDVEGMRRFDDGSTMTFYLNFSPFTGMGPAQFVVDDWREVGLRVIAREQQSALFYANRDSSDFDFMVWSSESDYFPLLEPRVFAPPDIEAYYATRWGRWFMQGGFYDAAKPAAMKGVQAPPLDHPIRRSYQAYVDALQLPDKPQQVKRFSEALEIAAENLWTINIAEAAPYLVVRSNDLHNVPDKAMSCASTRTPANAGVETYFLGHPSHVADSDTKALVSTPTPLPRVDAAGASATPSSAQASSAPASNAAVWLEHLIRWVLLGIGVGFLALLSLRHPFVARRLVVLVPTLLLISIVVFAIIQLPPGDFLTARIAALEETGDRGALAQLEDMKRIFRFDDPLWLQYLRWVGALWFTSFESADLGLLQGHMGLSMESGRAVNELVGDRIWLTIWISLGSLLLTWVLAIPIGVYSAVRQYSIGDYLVTLVGFVGMSVPPFLLALVLMVVSGTSGLFSPEYSAQPTWSWGKFWDLLAHIWLPIVVMGVSGTASMIRVMRANLLDELRKPYVTTARAKGVRPLKLLFKYPVRVALNPFVSGIGHVFPQLVSGGAIVSIVLSLPTVGPLQIRALLTEDMYLAGSMLMVMSLLSVFGTLVADLLLLWLDPRIRYGSVGES